MKIALQKRMFEDRFQKWKQLLLRDLDSLSLVPPNERDRVAKDLVWETEQVYRSVESVFDEEAIRLARAKEENELLRQIVGISEHELKSRLVMLEQERASDKRVLKTREEEIRRISERFIGIEAERDALKSALTSSEEARFQSEDETKKGWEQQVTFINQEHSVLNQELGELSHRLDIMREALVEQARELKEERHYALNNQRITLLDQMQSALRRQELLHQKEEHLLARGMSLRLRGLILASLGRMQFTLEKLHMLERVTDKRFRLKDIFHLLRLGSPELRQTFVDARARLAQAMEALKDYLAIIAPPAAKWKRVDIPGNLNIVLGDLTIPERVKIVTDYASSTPTVRGDEELLRKALGAVVTNALEIIGDKEGEIYFRSYSDEAAYEVCLSVRDSGPGLSSLDAERIFEPFYTTKKGHKGLGLPKAQRLIELHGGRIHWEPSEKAFVIRLPIYPDESVKSEEQ